MGERGRRSGCDDATFTDLFKSLGARGLAESLDIDIRSVYKRRRNIEENIGVLITAPTEAIWERSYAARIPIELPDGIVIIGSDAHYWPGIITTAHRAFCYLARELQPKIKILNGDVFDGATISRHPPLGWEKKPTVKQELECVEERVTEIADSHKDSDCLWTIGNHDARFELLFAKQTPQLEGVPGFELKDRFARWKFGLSYWVNDDVVIKHRWKGGIHATHNNTVNSGKSFVTGHLHSLKVTPFADYNGNRFGVDTGTLADPYGPQFTYSEDNPNNHRSGLVVLTFHKGRLLWPEIAHVIDAKSFEFRGKVIAV